MFALTSKHNYSLSDLEGMIPFERDLFVDMIKGEAEKANQQGKEQGLI